MKVNAGKSKVMVCSSGGKVIANFVQCTICKTWIHKRCSGVRDHLSLVVDGFRYKRCNGTNYEAYLAEDLVVETSPIDEETWMCICYPGDIHGGADIFVPGTLSIHF